ncbi:hypothetical protein [Arthrobacter sp. ISL-5]|uniref:hypothetical protein n=1 Tax=Arthrobacter sp. ISL-5 TaxID=2819111 RepID=UPI001BEAA95B|nr:hypothetical protein [Arthrobacter sp. ISL-5]MBT2551849.1 hypothetical protein [Arthrobacter sp. ISL-5]
MALAIVIGCTVLLLLGLLTVIRWGGHPLKGPNPVKGPGPARASAPIEAAPSPPLDSASPSSGEVRGAREDPSDAKIAALRKYLWWANVATFAALASALLAAWPGGRLIMRVLAFTSPDSAQGRLTEAQANVGFPTLEGSLALFLFAGLPAGYLVAILYVVLHRWLPAGRLAGPLLGVLLLIWLGGALLDPLRADNIDFNIVGPGWLAVALFTGLSILHGAVAAAAAGWWSERLPLWADRTAKYYVPLLLGFVLFPPAALAVGLGALALLTWMTIFPAGSSGPPRTARTPVWVGAGFLVAASAAALPAFVSAVISIASRTT